MLQLWIRLHLVDHIMQGGQKFLVHMNLKYGVLKPLVDTRLPVEFVVVLVKYLQVRSSQIFNVLAYLVDATSCPSSSPTSAQ